jgi:RNA-directed DNA polymerase
MADGESRTGAASHEKDPRTRDLRKAGILVRRLQARIVKAQREGRQNRAKVLQRLLVHSHSARLLAVTRVSHNEGRKTPGVDGVTWLTPSKQVKAVEALRLRGYRPLPLRRIYIPKKNGKLRPLGIPTMRDRAMQALYLLALDPIAETVADPNSYGFRKERSCADAISQCFILLARRGSSRWVLEGDIKACFDRISHAWLLAHVPLWDRTILRKWLQAGYLEKRVFHRTEEGTPQGGIISPVLANLALDGLEARLRERYPATTRQGRAAQVHLVRYADDFVITGRSRELLEQEVKPLVAQFLADRGLELSAEKTSVTPIETGFDFLGQNVRKYGGKLLIKPSKRNLTAFLENLREIVKGNRAAPASQLVLLLNPKIVGWANYHRHVCAKRTFTHVDYMLFNLLWQWAKRRHPNKSRRWIKQKYYTELPGPRGGNQWAFFGEVEEGDRKRPVLLRKASHTRIRRHVKIRSEVNPYDPRWWEYLAHRHRARGVTLPAVGSHPDRL